MDLPLGQLAGVSRGRAGANDVTERYYCESPIEGDVAELAGTEGHHLARVMRARLGHRVVLFNDTGTEYDAAVESIDRDVVRLRVLGGRPVDRELPLRLVLGVALPKGERQRWLVEKAVELGVGRLVPLWTARGVAQPVEQALARLRRAVVEASKQCGRNRLMEIGTPQHWADFAMETSDAACRAMAHPGGDAAGPLLLSGEPIPPKALLAVGPEGGFAEEEVAVAQASGWRLIGLGPRILRVETAALALVAQVLAELRGRDANG